jgi:hypothetical protein
MIEQYTQKIFFVDDDFLENLKEESINEYNEFVRPQIDTKLIKLPLQPENILELIDYVPPSEIRVGNILAKMGYGSQFDTIDEFAEEYIVRKYKLWVQLCIALGAKRVGISSAEEVFIDEQSRYEFEGGLKFEAPLNGIEANVGCSTNRDLEEKFKKILGFVAEAVGGEPDFVAAKDIMDRYGLFRDEFFESIYEMRKIKTNKMLSYRFTLDTTKDMKRMFDATTRMRLLAMSRIYKGKAEIASAENSIEKSRKAVKLDVVVEF